MRVVFDTNVIVSAFLSPQGVPSEIVKLWRQGVFDVVVSREMLDEYRRVLSRSTIRMRHGMTDSEIAAVIAGFEEVAILVTPGTPDVVIQGDPDDDKVIAAAVAGGAGYIVSGDAHLIDLREHRGIPILRPATLLAVAHASR